MRVAFRAWYWYVVGVVVLAALLFALFARTQDAYGVDADGMLHAPLRTELHATRSLLLSTENGSVYRVKYRSYGALIVGNLYVPTKRNGDGMVLLPGGGVDKEGEAPTARAFADRGFVVLTIDQRGVGETGGPFNSIEQDYAAFQAGQIPTNHQLILDALAAIQLLKEQPEVTSNVLLAGESMGGRAAMVAARMSDDIAGLLVISSSGFGDPQLPAEQHRFLASIDPDANIVQVRVPVLFLHSTNDTTIPLSAANATFQRATAPKRMFTVDGCPHGYCAAMEPLLDEGLAWMAQN